MKVGQKIRLVRRHRHLTQRELGDKLGLGEGGANRVAQYEMGYRVPKDELLRKIADVLDVPVENFFLNDDYIPDILRIMFWFDWEHPNVFRLTNTTENTESQQSESDNIDVKLSGNAIVKMVQQDIRPATVLWSDQYGVDAYLREWSIRKQELATHEITQEEYLEWLLQWPESSDLAGLREPRRRWRKGEYNKEENE